MSDGAHLGVTAGRALATIFGGETQPIDEEQKSKEEFASWIRLAPESFEDIVGEGGYSEASRWLARKYLLIMEEWFARSMYQRRPWSPQHLSMRDAAWADCKVKWPEDVKEAGGMTGFMHGWAFNAARHVLGMPPTRNPALLTILLGKRKVSLPIVYTKDKWQVSSMQIDK